MCMEIATLTITNTRDQIFLYQTIRIMPSNRSHIRYYFNDRYKAAREVDKFLRQLYLGDGKNVFFVEKQKFRHQILLKYRIDNEIEIDLSEKKYYIKAKIPKYDGCEFCNHYRPSKKGNSRCLYYREFIKKPKIFCSDFEEK